MSVPSERLYALLPAFLRVRDDASGGALRALMTVLEQELVRIETDLETTYDNWFVETCEEWLVPYLGATLGVQGVRSLTGVDDAGSRDFTLRGYVANTLARRRRKGTAAATEALARDVTGYPCRAVEMFARTSVTAQVNHLRGADVLPAPYGTADLRDPARCERIGGPFEQVARTADVRPMSDGLARPNLPNVALHLWRTQAVEHTGTQARPLGGVPGWFQVDALGAPVPLFNLPVPEQDPTVLAGPEHVPHPLTRLELDRLRSATDPLVEARVSVGGDVRTLVTAVCSLVDDAGALSARRPPAGTAAVDPVVGAVVLADEDLQAPPGTEVEVLVDHATGSPGRLGAGPYDRTTSWLTQRDDGVVTWQAGVGRDEVPVGAETVVGDLDEAVLAWNAAVAGVPAADRSGMTGLVVLLDSRSYAAPAVAVDLPDGARLHVVAGLWPVRDEDGVPARAVGDLVPAGVRPHVIGDLLVHGTVQDGAPRPGGLLLNGLLVEGAVRVVEGDLERLDLASCTVTDGVAVAVAGDDRNERLEIVVDRSIVGPAVAAGAVTSLRATNSVVRTDVEDPDLADDPATRAVDLPGTAVVLDGCTVVGGIRARTLWASECVLDEGARRPARALEIAVRQEGCLRFSYVAPQAAGPRRHRCEPDESLVGLTDPATRADVVARVRPVYDGTSIGHPGFFLLSPGCPSRLRTAAADGSEPGVWHHLGHALRMSNLTAALQQYLRFGLEAGAVFDR
ncbi:MAG: hypothetical protein IR158_03110 [Cellulomonas sp.]|uniref:phage tail protein n=1 Tax=Cellulomonas sp. TaxID=40001 RepID=UPI001A0967DC|nr:phage tail protein [Cellulomonas sp.]MBF0686744.1 hypothetical protein [Cellulomonas sp.]